MPCFSYLTKKMMFAIFLCLFLEVTLLLWLFGIICCSPWYCQILLFVLRCEIFIFIPEVKEIYFTF